MYKKGIKFLAACQLAAISLFSQVSTVNAATDFILQITPAQATYDSDLGAWMWTNPETNLYEQATVVQIDVAGPEGVGVETGDVISSLPIDKYGSRFILFGSGIAPDTNLYNLKEKLVHPYRPQVEIVTSSEDQYEGVTRTRADEKYQGKIYITNLIGDTTAPESSRKVLLEVLTSEYEAGRDRVSEYGDLKRVVEQIYIVREGDTWYFEDVDSEERVSFSPKTEYKDGVSYYTLTCNTLSSLLSEFEYKQKGEEYIRVLGLPNEFEYVVDEHGNVEQADWQIIDEEKIQVWPIADASLLAKLADEPFTLSGRTLNKFPSLIVDLVDLYPTSKTYVRIYKGPAVENYTGEQIILQEVVANDYDPTNFNTVTPQRETQIISSESWNHSELEDGEYTVEIITETPFTEQVVDADGNPVGINTKKLRLVYSTFSLKRTVQFFGNATDSENK
ncbi:hypothetical protein SAMN02745181_3539 [Rubritalea squalenifaciens DSM 18772]|uniref:Uncharacterized protein n=1 Tax=Rubritalea squalenifaciens DSM 18772 TaxID=1123071 RepID=A0A1M6R3Y1_9BACT|nr:hypothetical protein [Rubritalea squalenifaciens]SHK27110.1 hypothetical protein SAMN02745181_3539 [Rubritalea squalenifaciens DSM 18772]